MNKKRANYQLAKELLDDLTPDKVKSKTKFLEVYERLVGAKDKQGLWHSRGLFRSKNIVAEKYELFLQLLSAVREKIKDSPDVVLEVGLNHARNINGLGPNVLTEIMNTYSPENFAVFNNNPVSSLAYLGFENFGSLEKKNFLGQKYLKFNKLIWELSQLCGFVDLSQVDHFLNFVYEKYAKPKKATTT